MYPTGRDMIFNDDFIFIHIGKTGGMSCSDYLLHNLKPPVYNCHHNATADMKRLKKTGGIVPVPEIHRHCTLQEALDFIGQFNGKQLSDFTKVVAVIRHPYTLEYSFYKHLQKPPVRENRKDNKRLLELADGDFKTFVEKAQLHRKDHTQDTFFHVDNKIPSNLELVRFERLPVDFEKAVSPFLKRWGKCAFPHYNRTKYSSGINRELAPGTFGGNCANPLKCSPIVASP